MLELIVQDEVLLNSSENKWLRRNCVDPPFPGEEKSEEQNFQEAHFVGPGQEACRGDPGLACGDLPLESKFLVWFPKHRAQRGISEVSRL